ncbi:MAG: hypothetical protein ACXW0H_08225 [Methylobacter sp.]
MSTQLIKYYKATGFDRLVHRLRSVDRRNSELSLHHLVLISRILFAIFIIGFMGYFFDRLMQTLFTLEGKAKTNSHQER